MRTNQEHMAASPPSTSWTGNGADTSWFDAGNLRGGVPQVSTRTVFKTGHADTVDLAAILAGQTATSGAVLVVGDRVSLRHGALTMIPPSPAHGLAIDLQVTAAGTLVVAPGARLTGQGEVLVGDGTTDGTMLLHGSLSDSEAAILGLTSQVTVSGARAHWSNAFSLSIGGASSQEARLAIGQGGTVDGGPDAFTTGFSIVAIGNGFGAGLAVVHGVGSLLRVTGLDVGTAYSGTLEIRAGARVVDRVGEAGGNGDGTVEVSGAGSLWQNINEIQVGQQVPVASLLRITDHGTASVGAFGVQLAGTLEMDATATLQADAIVSAGGAIRALDTTPGSGGTVTIGGSLELTGNQLAPFQLETTYVSSDPHAVLDLTGQIGSFDPNAILQVGTGHVVLSNAADSLPTIALYGGVLEIAATGATGTAALRFLTGSTPTLQIDAGVTVGNAISGFGGLAAFDFTGIAFVPGEGPAWSAGSGGGTLGVSDGVHGATLDFLGSYSVASFQAATDGHGGTLVTFVPGHA